MHAGKAPLSSLLRGLHVDVACCLHLVLNTFLVTHRRHTSVHSECGPEQEFFLIDHDHYKSRPDLVVCGRTVFGAVSVPGSRW